jgi:hypothetical protein
MKTLKIWNGRGHRKYYNYHIYVAAYTIKQAVELINTACDSWITSREIAVYYSKGCWGNSMDGIIPTEPCVYVLKEYDYNNKPIRVL